MHMLAPLVASDKRYRVNKSAFNKAVLSQLPADSKKKSLVSQESSSNFKIED